MPLTASNPTRRQLAGVASILRRSYADVLPVLTDEASVQIGRRSNPHLHASLAVMTRMGYRSLSPADALRAVRMAQQVAA